MCVVFADEKYQKEVTLRKENKGRAFYWQRGGFRVAEPPLNGVAETGVAFLFLTFGTFGHVKVHHFLGIEVI